MKKIIQRTTNQAVYDLAKKTGLNALQARIIANRCDEKSWDENIVASRLNVIQAPHFLKNCQYAAQRITKAIEQGEDIGILTDYDVDGITSHAIIFYALTRYFNYDKAKIHSYIGHRINQGYGISGSLTQDILSRDSLPKVIITADCGSSDEEQISLLAQAGIDVIVTDHHAIPQQGIPISAYATINPNQTGCTYADKTIAGCMVAWLLMSQVRQQLINEKILTTESKKLTNLLDFVALGTVADAVSLASLTNRAAVNAGLQVMNKLEHVAWQAMAKLLKKESFEVEDLGFQLGPRINARSRMADPYAALEMLTADNLTIAIERLEELDQNNKDRRTTEKEMLKKAEHLVLEHQKEFVATVVIFDEQFHAGVQGIVASRLVEQYGLPTIVFSETTDSSILTASARTVEAVDIRQMLQQVDDEQKNLLVSFGGHKGAAGLKIKKQDLALFKQTFESVVANFLQQQNLQLFPLVYSDGELSEQQINNDTRLTIAQLSPYGRGFEQVSFCNEFIIQSYRQIGQFQQHLSLMLILGKTIFRAIWFNSIAEGGFCPFNEGETVRVVYQINADTYRNEQGIQLMVQYLEKKVELNMFAP